ncbi:hypothetical protein B0H67DRAFT_486868, partial [Lasiosphaeris hirsuta]
VLVRQFRPQYEADTVEFPAGFISRRPREGGVAETPAQAAVRELEEETTMTGAAVAGSPLLTSDPVPIAARLSAVFVKAREKVGDEAGRQRLDKGEFTEEVRVPLVELEATLNQLGEAGVVVDPRVWMFAMGIRFALELELQGGVVSDGAGREGAWD